MTTRTASAERNALINTIMTENPGLSPMKVAALIKNATGLSTARCYNLYREAAAAGVGNYTAEPFKAPKAPKAPKEPRAPKAPKAPKVARAPKVAKTDEELAEIKAKNLAAIKAAAEKANRVRDYEPGESMAEVDAMVENIIGDEKPEDFVPKFMHKELGIGDFRDNAE